ncbi:hypothetical protein, partial [Streptosporangium sp. NPDC003464]
MIAKKLDRSAVQTVLPGRPPFTVADLLGFPDDGRDLAEAVETAFDVDVRVHRLPDGFDGLSWAD